MLVKEFYGSIKNEKTRIEFRKELYDEALRLSREGYSIVNLKCNLTPNVAKVKLFYIRPIRTVLVEKSKMFNYTPIPNVFKTIRSMNLIVDEEYEEQEYEKFCEQLKKDKSNIFQDFIDDNDDEG